MPQTIRNLLTVAGAGLTCLGACHEARAQWSGKGEIGLVFASGNTDARNANAKVEVAATLARWKHSAGLAAIYAASEDLTTGQRWEAYEQSDYDFGARGFWFGAARYEDDRFSGFEYQATLSTGGGRHFIDSEHTKFTGSVGVGYKLFRTRDTFDTAGMLVERGGRSNEAVLRGTLDYSHDLTETAKVGNKLLVESGSDNTFLNNDLAVQVKMSDQLALAVAYSTRYNTKPPPGFGKTDNLTTLNLVYEVK
jgi:putative salt-induced outer membrane protein